MLAEADAADAADAAEAAGAAAPSSPPSPSGAPAPAAARTDDETARLHTDVGWALMDTLLRYDDAAPHFQAALALDEARLGPHHAGVASRAGNLGLLYKVRNDVSHKDWRPFTTSSNRRRAAPPRAPRQAHGPAGRGDVSR